MTADAPSETDLATIRALPLWRGEITVEALSGGITNRNFVVTDATRKAVVRLGGDIPVHGIMRFNEVAASRAAAAAGISPAVLDAGPGYLVLDFVEGETLDEAGVRRRRDACVELVARAHRDMADHLRGPLLSFNTFHVLRHYGHALREGGHRLAGHLPDLLAVADRLARTIGPIDLIFGHNDLLAANFIDDGSRLWLVDWDYAGFNTPLFDLAGLSSNNGFGAADDAAMLGACFPRVDDHLRLRFAAVRCASLLREAMWSMVSEIHSGLDFDYAAYTAENLARFEAALGQFAAMDRS
ncbi:phosphotransferase family protein [Zavarzinia compransoris]|uniref:choline/ethanolamine kinase family protein n=1 Tax=Zavarzinia marina TaxID=2911065 RepID=UPI001F41D9F2|nr:choline/ethanolamine kinase family protein [Zavarzinia marina]MCF4167241.1 phosphotransferase family protein [Zavarzinia marina]